MTRKSTLSVVAGALLVASAALAATAPVPRPTDPKPCLTVSRDARPCPVWPKLSPSTAPRR